MVAGGWWLAQWVSGPTNCHKLRPDRKKGTNQMLSAGGKRSETATEIALQLQPAAG